MIIAAAFKFFDDKNFRDMCNNKIITFGKAFQIGQFIALITSTFYVVI
jgi:hypothetical protein